MKNKKLRNFLIIAGSFIIMVIYLVFFNKDGGTTSSSSSGSESMAYIMSQQFVENSLKSPSTAKFPSLYKLGDHAVLTTGTNYYEIKAYVDSQNGFGAMIRTHYTCNMKYKGNNTWGCENLEFE